MREVIDKHSGAILFKSDEDSEEALAKVVNLEKKIDSLEKKIAKLEKRLKALEE